MILIHEQDSIREHSWILIHQSQTEAAVKGAKQLLPLPGVSVSTEQPLPQSSLRGRSDEQLNLSLFFSLGALGCFLRLAAQFRVCWALEAALE